MNRTARAGESPAWPAGTGTLAIPVDRKVANGTVVAVTVEDDGGARAPSGERVIASAPVTPS